MEIAIRGRHDPIIVPRAVVVVEAMTGICVLDMMMAGVTSRLDYLKKIWT
jgi:chorismate synthase